MGALLQRSNLTYHPHDNPLMEVAEIPLKKRRTRSALISTENDVPQLLDARNGEPVAATVTAPLAIVDDQHFVKVFADGVSAAYELSTPAKKVFLAILQAYEKSPLTGGYSDTVYLSWFNGGLCGESVGMQQRTFTRGLKELIEKRFLAPKTPEIFWVNPALFFKGDRALLIKEFRRKRRKTAGEKAIEHARRMLDAGVDITSSRHAWDLQQQATPIPVSRYPVPAPDDVTDAQETTQQENE